jgi:hypothetical protein
MAPSTGGVDSVPRPQEDEGSSTKEYDDVKESDVSYNNLTPPSSKMGSILVFRAYGRYSAIRLSLRAPR